MNETAAVILCCAVCLGLVWYYREKSKRQYRQIECMLDEILNERPVSQSDLEEGEIAELSHKARRIQEKLNLEVQSARKEKEQVKSLISNMSHQLKTPLSNVMMYQEILESSSLEEEQRKKFLEKLKTQSEKIDWILQSLFKMVNLENGVIRVQPEEKNIKATLSRALSGVYEKAQRRNIEITTEEFPDSTLYHDPRWTAEVLGNLLENAVKYTDPGGRIVVRLVPYELYSKLEIIDNGRGIAKEELSCIFQRFYRSNDVRNLEGSGIGLYLSRLILEKEKGYLTVESEYGRGSCFQVFLQNCKN
ncbi:sensor histidine kinase [Lactonifactor longoviformis]|uniref:sensor histidine kinase n=1 Tax=Lactonifactor longoviformis TaxID=341220 RepID=UPI0036F376EC